MYSHFRQATVVVIILVLYPSLCSSVLRYDGAVKPSDPFLFEGETLSLSCRLYNTSNKNITLYFKYQHKDSSDNNCRKQKGSGQHKRNLTQYIIRTNESHIGLVVPNVSISDSGHYCCVEHDNDTCYESIAKQIVTIERDLKKVTDFRCIVKDWQDMICTWQHNVNYSCPDLVEVNLTYISIHEPTPKLCPSLVNNSCFWNPPFINDNYTMMLTVRHERRGNRTEESNFAIDTWHHVKPNSVKDLTAVPLNSTCVALHWDRNTERTWEDLEFLIQYRRTSVNWPKVNETLTFTDSTTQCNLRPYTNYTFQVWVKPRTKGYRSEPEEAHVQTWEDLPTEVPETCPGCFHQFQCPGKVSQRCVTVYWRDIPEENKHGRITYVVQLNDVETLNTTETCITFSGVNTSSRDSPAIITPSTKAGKALKNTTIVMFHERLDPLKDLVVEVLDTFPKEYFISWKDSNRNTALDRNITIVWCYRRSADKECETQINWIDVATPALNYTLSPDVHARTGHQTEGLGIRIGISSTGMSAGGARQMSSGIQWSTCVYHYNQRPNTGPRLLPPKGTNVSWEIEPCPNAYVTGYSITYCQTSDERTCEGSKMSFNVSNSVNWYDVQGITPDTKYLVYIEAWSRNGISISSNSSDPTNTKIIQLYAFHKDVLSKTVDYPWYIISGVLSFLILLALVIFLIWFCYKSKVKFQTMVYGTESNAPTNTDGSGDNPVQDVNKPTRLDYLKMLKNCCSPRIKNHSERGTSDKNSDSGTPLLGGGGKVTENKESLPIHSKDEFETSKKLITGNKHKTLEKEILKEENASLLDKILKNGQSHPISTEGSIPKNTQDMTKSVDIDKMLVEYKSQGEDIDRLPAGDGKQMSGRPQTRCAHTSLDSCRIASNKSNDSYIRISDDVSALAVGGHDVQDYVKMVGDSGHDRNSRVSAIIVSEIDTRSHVPAIADSGHDIQSHVEITEDSGHDTHGDFSAKGDSGHDMHNHMPFIADSGHDIHNHMSFIADSGHDIHNHVSAIGDSGHDIQSYVKITGDSEHDIHNHMPAIADCR